jgi:hypothetical protein
MLRYLHGRAPVGAPITPGELAREPRSLALVAWFDGWERAALRTGRYRVYPRPLDVHEARAWLDGWREGLEQRRELVDVVVVDDELAGSSRDGGARTPAPCPVSLPDPVHRRPGAPDHERS